MPGEGLSLDPPQAAGDMLTTSHSLTEPMEGQEVEKKELLIDCQVRRGFICPIIQPH